MSCAVRREREACAGFSPVRRTVPPELVGECDGVRTTSPALTVLDLCDEGTDAIDKGLGRGAISLAGLYDALRLTAKRQGNLRRLQSLLDSRDEPCSAAERLAHRILRERGLTHRRTNYPVTARRKNCLIDVAFPRSKVAVEIDGRFRGRDEAAFERDRLRQNALVLDEWIVLRFTMRRLEDEPGEVVAEIRDALASSHSWRLQRRGRG